MPDSSDAGTYPEWMSEETREMFERLRALYWLEMRIKQAKNVRNHMTAEGFDVY